MWVPAIVFSMSENFQPSVMDFTMQKRKIDINMTVEPTSNSPVSLLSFQDSSRRYYTDRKHLSWNYHAQGRLKQIVKYCMMFIVLLNAEMWQKYIPGSVTQLREMLQDKQNASVSQWYSMKSFGEFVHARNVVQCYILRPKQRSNQTSIPDFKAAKGIEISIYRQPYF